MLVLRTNTVQDYTVDMKMKGIRPLHQQPKIDPDLLKFIREFENRLPYNMMAELLGITGPAYRNMAKANQIDISVSQVRAQGQHHRIQRARTMWKLREKYGPRIAALQPSINKVKEAYEPRKR